jgi:6-phosphogluconate dehydrogenase
MNSKQIGYIGLGKMGLNMAERLLEKGWMVVAYDSDAAQCAAAQAIGIKVADSISSLISDLGHPKTVWLMAPHGVVDSLLGEVVPLLDEGDTVIDGGNSFYEDSMRRAGELKSLGINFLDVGVSGGPRGASDGACLMVGGERGVFEKLNELWLDLSAEGGYSHIGESGAGHYAKMIHNGIEYGMMQSMAEGFTLLKSSQFDMDLAEIARLYNHGSVIESRLIGWSEKGMRERGEELQGVSGNVALSGEGEWTVETAKKLGIETPCIEAAVQFRKDSQNQPSYAGKILTMLRNQFGGHAIN